MSERTERLRQAMERSRSAAPVPKDDVWALLAERDALAALVSDMADDLQEWADYADHHDPDLDDLHVTLALVARANGMLSTPVPAAGVPSPEEPQP